MEKSNQSDQLAMFETPKVKVEKVADEKKQKIVKYVTDETVFSDEEIRKDLSPYCTVDVKLNMKDDVPWFTIEIHEVERDEYGEDSHGSSWELGGSDLKNLMAALLKAKVGICAQYYDPDRYGIGITRVRADRVYVRFSEPVKKYLTEQQWEFDMFWYAWNSLTQEPITDEVRELQRQFDEHEKAEGIYDQLDKISDEIDIRFSHCSPETYWERREQGFAHDVAKRPNKLFEERNKKRPFADYGLHVLEKMFEKLLDQYYQANRTYSDARNQLWGINEKRCEAMGSKAICSMIDTLHQKVAESVSHSETRTEIDTDSHSVTRKKFDIDLLDATDMPDFKTSDYPDLVEFEKAQMAEKPLRLGQSYTVRVIKENESVTGNVQVRHGEEGFDIYWVVYGIDKETKMMGNKEYLLDGDITDELYARVKSYKIADRLQEDLEEFKAIISEKSKKEKVEVAKVEVFKI
ncbi:MAG: hypothetical protein EH225_10565 [Calditrichaeota bacterium]|nr:MAG: hypothetical protein EH225_10565 [Calditrichota bacterium]